MKTDLIYLQEPKLDFGYQQQMDDPRDGLTLFGPYEQFTSYSVQAGVIGTWQGIEYYQSFVAALQHPLFSSAVKRPTFPGFETVFGVAWSSKPAVTRVIEGKVLEETLALSSLKERIYKTVNLFLEPIRRFQKEEETKIDLWFVVIPKQVWQRCRPMSEDKPNQQFNPKQLKEFRSGQRFLLPELDAEYQEMSEFYDYSSDFHDQLKARLLQEGITVPVQVIQEPTLQFRDKYREEEYEPEMKAHLAWTQASAVYYKLGKLPWKLSGVRRGVCYLGLVFKRYIRFEKQGYACSAAQMFLDSGDGTVFRGNVGPWESRSSKEFHLNRSSAKELLEKALSSYRERKGEYPTEVFIHGRAGFADEEWSGFLEAVSGTNAPTKLVGIVIRESNKLKLFRDVVGENCRYGNLRGLALPIDDWEGYLWTRGFIPRLNTSMSLEIPNPLRVQINKGKADINQVLIDILALTKLNYNACVYGDGLPVTLRFSDVIGNILTAVANINTPALPFKYYI